jgi:HK97 gp10 family phage protein
MVVDRVSMKGLRELEQALTELPKATARNTLNRVLKLAAEPVQRAWQAKAPRESGALAKSVIVGKRLTRRQAKDAKREGKFFAELHVGTADPAGVQQEFGNINHPAQPSGRPAWEQTQDMALATISVELGGEIEKARARLARKAAKLAG